jgi:hypothetical protein
MGEGGVCIKILNIKCESVTKSVMWWVMGDAGILITQHKRPISLCFFYSKCVGLKRLQG